MGKGRGKHHKRLDQTKQKSLPKPIEMDNHADEADLSHLAMQIQSFSQTSLTEDNIRLIHSTVHTLKHRTKWLNQDFKLAIAILSNLFNKDLYYPDNRLAKHELTCLLLQVFISKFRSIRVVLVDRTLRSPLGIKDKHTIEQIPGIRNLPQGQEKVFSPFFETNYNLTFDPVIELLTEFQKRSYETDVEQLKGFTFSILQEIEQYKTGIWANIKETLKNSNSKKGIDFIGKKQQELRSILEKFIGEVDSFALENISAPLFDPNNPEVQEIKAFLFVPEASQYQKAISMCFYINQRKNVKLEIAQAIFSELAREKSTLIPLVKSKDLLTNLEPALLQFKEMAGVLAITEYEITLAKMMDRLEQKSDSGPNLFFDSKQVRFLSPQQKALWINYGTIVIQYLATIKTQLVTFSEFLNEVYQTNLLTTHFDKRPLVEICYHTARVILEKIIKPYLEKAILTQDSETIAQLLHLYNHLCHLLLETTQTVHQYFHPMRTECLSLFSAIIDVGFMFSYLTLPLNNATEIFYNNLMAIHDATCFLHESYASRVENNQSLLLLTARAGLLKQLFIIDHEDLGFLFEFVDIINQNYRDSIPHLTKNSHAEALLTSIQQWFTQLFTVLIHHPVLRQENLANLNYLKRVLSDFAEIIRLFNVSHLFESSFLFNYFQPLFTASEHFIQHSPELINYQTFLQEQLNIEKWSNEYNQALPHLYTLLISNQSYLQDCSFFSNITKKFNQYYVEKNDFFEKEKEKLAFFQLILNNDVFTQNALFDFHRAIKKLHRQSINPILTVSALFNELELLVSNLSTFLEAPLKSDLVQELSLHWKKELFIATVNVLLQDFNELVGKIKKSVNFFLDKKEELIHFFIDVQHFLDIFLLTKETPHSLKRSLDAFYTQQERVQNFTRKQTALPMPKPKPSPLDSNANGSIAIDAPAKKKRKRTKNKSNMTNTEAPSPVIDSTLSAVTRITHPQPKINTQESGKRRTFFSFNPRARNTLKRHRARHTFTINEYIQAALSQVLDKLKPFEKKSNMTNTSLTQQRKKTFNKRPSQSKYNELKPVQFFMPHQKKTQLDEGFRKRYSAYLKKIERCQNAIAFLQDKIPTLHHPFLIEELYFVLNQYLHEAAAHCTIILGVMNGLKSPSSEKVNTYRHNCSEILLKIIIQIQELPWKYAQINKEKRDYSISHKLYYLINLEYKLKQLDHASPLTSEHSMKAILSCSPDINTRLSLELELQAAKKGILGDLLKLSKNHSLIKELSEFLNYSDSPADDLPCAQAFFQLSFISLYESFSYFDFVAYQHYHAICELERNLNPDKLFLLNDINIQLLHEYEVIKYCSTMSSPTALAHQQWLLLGQFYGHLLDTVAILSRFISQEVIMLDKKVLLDNWVKTMEELEEQQEELAVNVAKEPIRDWGLTALDNLKNLLLFKKRMIEWLIPLNQASAQPSNVGMFASSLSKQNEEPTIAAQATL